MSTFWKRDDEGSLSFSGSGGYDVFVETGTQLGRTLIAAVPIFSDVRSVDISPDNVARAAGILKGDTFNLWVGDSGVVIQAMIADLADKAVCFWLDAHATDGGTPAPQCPLADELAAIAGVSWVSSPLILIDDAPCFGAKEPMFGGQRISEWPTMDQIVAILGDRWKVAVEGLVIVCRPS